MDNLKEEAPEKETKKEKTDNEPYGNEPKKKVSIKKTAPPKNIKQKQNTQGKTGSGGKITLTNSFHKTQIVVNKSIEELEKILAEIRKGKAC